MWDDDYDDVLSIGRDVDAEYEAFHGARLHDDDDDNEVYWDEEEGGYVMKPYRFC